MAHIVKIKLGTHMIPDELYKQVNWIEWKNLYSIHLLINHRSYMDKESDIKEFNETNIWTYNRTYGVMARTILRKANIYVPQKDIFRTFD